MPFPYLEGLEFCPALSQACPTRGWNVELVVNIGDTPPSAAAFRKIQQNLSGTARPSLWTLNFQRPYLQQCIIHGTVLEGFSNRRRYVSVMQYEPFRPRNGT